MPDILDFLPNYILVLNEALEKFGWKYTQRDFDGQEIKVKLKKNDEVIDLDFNTPDKIGTEFYVRIVLGPTHKLVKAATANNRLLVDIITQKNWSANWYAQQNDKLYGFEFIVVESNLEKALKVAFQNLSTVCDWSSTSKVFAQLALQK